MVAKIDVVRFNQKDWGVDRVKGIKSIELKNGSITARELEMFGFPKIRGLEVIKDDKQGVAVGTGDVCVAILDRQSRSTAMTKAYRVENKGEFIISSDQARFQGREVIRVKIKKMTKRG